MARKRKPGGGRKKSKPDYDPSAILQNQMDLAVALYDKEEHPSLQTIANELDLNPIKVRKLLITAGVYKSDAADQVQRVFNKHRASGLSHTEAITATMRELNLSKSSVTSYLPYEKGVYFPAETDNKNLSVGAERIRRMRKRNKVLETLLNEQSEEALWAAVIEFQGYKFRTYSGLVFSYSLKKAYSHSTSDDLWSLQWCHFYAPSLPAVYEKYKERGGRPVFHPADIKPFTTLLTDIYDLASSSDYIRDMRINEKLGTLLTKWCKLHIPLVGRIAAFLRKVLKEV